MMCVCVSQLSTDPGANIIQTHFVRCVRPHNQTQRTDKRTDWINERLKERWPGLGGWSGVKGNARKALPGLLPLGYPWCPARRRLLLVAELSLPEGRKRNNTINSRSINEVSLEDIITHTGLNAKTSKSNCQRDQPSNRSKDKRIRSWTKAK